MAGAVMKVGCWKRTHEADLLPGAIDFSDQFTEAEVGGKLQSWDLKASLELSANKRRLQG